MPYSRGYDLVLVNLQLNYSFGRFQPFSPTIQAALGIFVQLLNLHSRLCVYVHVCISESLVDGTTQYLPIPPHSPNRSFSLLTITFSVSRSAIYTILIVLHLGVINGGLGLQLANHTEAGKIEFAVLAGCTGLYMIGPVLFKTRITGNSENGRAIVIMDQNDPKSE